MKLPLLKVFTDPIPGLYKLRAQNMEEMRALPLGTSSLVSAELQRLRLKINSSPARKIHHDGIEVLAANQIHTA